jgi:outer membrane receptor protein involved in Fe transport
MNKLKILIAIMLFYSWNGLFAQGPGGQMEIPANGIITGKVVDDQGKPLEYATISLVSLRDSAIISGAISDTEGKFKMADLKLGVYVMKIKVLGYETKEVKPIFLMPKGRGKGEGIEQNFDNITLGNSEIKLDDVTIVGEKSRVQYKIDKKVINPSQDIAASSGTAVEILQNTPSVNVDIDGNVELRGSSNFTVLIDGKPTVLTGSEALQQIPANLVENIEIITNPSAKYDPDGAAGIINVVLKKKKSLGVTGLVNLSAGTKDKYKGNVTLAYKTGKVGFNASIDYRNEKRYGSGTQLKETDYLKQLNIIDSSSYSNYDGSRDMHMKGLGFQGGLDFYLNDKNTLSISGRYNDRDFGFISNSYYHDWNNPQTFDNYYLRQSESGFGGSSYNLNLDYSLKFNKPDQKLDFSFSYQNRDGDRKSDQFKYYTDANKNLLDIEPELNKSDETGPENDYRFKLDFVSPVGQSGVFESGYQGRIEIEDQNFIYSNFNSPANSWIIDPIKSNNVKFSDNIQALYTTYANKIWGFDYKFGLRAEYNLRTLDQLTAGDDYKFDKFDLFPSAYITRQLTKTQQIQLNYSRRINRPDGRELDPFKDYSDPKNIRAGNPELDPEYVDSYELNFQQQLKKSFISFETYYRRTNNLISQDNKSLGGDTTLITYKNYDHDNSIGFEMNANLFITNWWRLNVSGSGFYYQINNQDAFSNNSRESFNYNFKFDNSFSLKSKTKIQLTGFYRGPSVTAQGTSEGFFFSNIAIRQDLLKGKLTLSAQLQDIFGSAKMKSGSEYETSMSPTLTIKQNISQVFMREARVVTFSLTYRLNNFKQKRSSEKPDDVEMEMDMPQ